MSNVKHDQNVKTVEEKKRVLKHFGQLEIELEIDNWKFPSSLFLLFWRDSERSVCSDINEKSIQDQQNELALDGIS